MQRSRLFSFFLAAGLAATFGCAHGAAPSDRGYVWAHLLPATGEGPSYLIAAGDLLNIQVWEQEKLSGKLRVRQDGRISMLFLNDVEAAGKTPTALATELERGLKPFVLNPRVNVVVDEAQPLSVSVLGEVVRPGAYTLEPDSSLAHALAAAGGLTSYAHRDDIYVVRRHPQPVRIRFTYEDVTGARTRNLRFALRRGDVVVVE
jgi:polysaccharide biosynthesis/export protein